MGILERLFRVSIDSFIKNLKYSKFDSFGSFDSYWDKFNKYWEKKNNEKQEKYEKYQKAKDYYYNYYKNYKYGNYNNSNYKSSSTMSDEQKKIAQYYANLEIPNGSDFETVRKAWKTLLKKYHPDKFNLDEQKRKQATVLTQKLNEAYSALEKYLKNKENN